MKNPARAGRPKTGGSKPVPLRLDEQLSRDVETASRQLREDAAATMRLAMRIGLKYLDRIQYDVAGAVLEQAASRASIDEVDRARIAAAAQRERK
jgi:hypothetical protein